MKNYARNAAIIAAVLLLPLALLLPATQAKNSKKLITFQAAEQGTIQVNVSYCDNAALPLQGVSVFVNGNPSGSTDANGQANSLVAVGVYTVLVSKQGFFPQTIDNVSVTDGNLTVVNVCLTAAPVIVVDTTDITAESCPPVDEALSPGETVTVNFALKNTGLVPTTNLVAMLEATGGITSPSGPRNYGVLQPAGAAVTQPFSFTVDPNAVCGSTITATLQLLDGVNNLGTATFTFVLGTTVTSTHTFANPGPIAIPGIGTSGAANPFPSIISVSGVTGPVSRVAVRLNNINHTFPDDVDMLLVSPTGQKFIVMSDAGGGFDLVNNTITIDDAAASAIPDASAIGTGTFKPANYGNAEAFLAPAPAAPYNSPAPTGAATFASVFGGQNPNGDWQLFVQDDLGGDAGNISGGWELIITTEEPVCCESPCTLTCPADITVPSDAGVCGANVTFPAPSVSGSCGVVTYSHASGSFFPVGTTVVTATATRSDGATSSCTFNVTVNDTESPSVSSAVAVSSLNAPFDHSLINVGLSGSATDGCSGTADIQVLVFGNEDDEAGGDGAFSPDAMDLGMGTLRLRRERKGDGNGRVYLVIVRATDTAGNPGESVQTVVVPSSNSAADKSAVQAEAAAAKAYFMVNHAPPAGYFVIGDGPLVGARH